MKKLGFLLVMLSLTSLTIGCDGDAGSGDAGGDAPAATDSDDGGSADGDEAADGYDATDGDEADG